MSRQSGLSPRVRGNREARRRRHGPAGPIPACAGQPKNKPDEEFVVWAYPRVCGATGHRGLTLFQLPGLSPRVRGNPHAQQVARLKRGPIPACAGQPTRKPPVRWTAWAYPRVCGATCGCCYCKLFGSGLSPRVRGNPCFSAPVWVCPGPIPACAGQPLHRPQPSGK